VDLQSPEPNLSFTLNTEHDGKKNKLQKKIEGVRKWKEEDLEKGIQKKIEKLKPKWEEKAKDILKKIDKN
jgi:hypothetical protein